jgi:hypothetical protein
LGKKKAGGADKQKSMYVKYSIGLSMSMALYVLCISSGKGKHKIREEKRREAKKRFHY